MGLRARLSVTGAVAGATGLGSFLYILNPGPMIGLGRALALAVGVTVIVTAAVVALLSAEDAPLPARDDDATRSREP